MCIIWSTNIIGQLTPKIVIIWVVVKKVDVSSSFPTDTLGGLLTSVALGRNFSCHFLLRLFPARDSFTLIIREEIRHSLDMKKASRNSLVAAFASSHHFSLVVRELCRSGFVQGETLVSIYLHWRYRQDKSYWAAKLFTTTLSPTSVGFNYQPVRQKESRETFLYFESFKGKEM